MSAKKTNRGIPRPIRWTEEEIKLVEEAAVKSGLDFSSFVRSFAIKNAKRVLKT